MSTAQEIEDAIRSLSPSERAKLPQHLLRILPEFAGDQEWDRIIVDERPRPAFGELLNRYEAELSEDPEKFPKAEGGPGVRRWARGQSLISILEFAEGQ